MEVLNRDLLESTAGITSSFSVIYTSMVLHHIEDTLKILEIFNALLDSPGYLCIADLDSDGGLSMARNLKATVDLTGKILKKKCRSSWFTMCRFEPCLKLKNRETMALNGRFPVFSDAMP